MNLTCSVEIYGHVLSYNLVRRYQTVLVEVCYTSDYWFILFWEYQTSGL